MIAASLLCLSASAFAQYVGPSGTGSPTTVQQLLENGKDDQYATIEGNIIRHIAGEHYVFADKTGQINVEIKNRDLPPSKMDDKTKVSLTGKLDKDFNESLELEVKQLKILP